MDQHLGAAYARVWAGQQVIGALDGRTVTEALDQGTPAKEVWRAVWSVLELPDSEK